MAGAVLLCLPKCVLCVSALLAGAAGLGQRLPEWCGPPAADHEPRPFFAGAVDGAALGGLGVGLAGLFWVAGRRPAWGGRRRDDSVRE